MRYRVLGFAAAWMLAQGAFAFGQTAQGSQNGTAAGQRGQRGATFTTNGNGGIVDVNGQAQEGVLPGQRGQRGGPVRPVPRGPDGRVLLSAPLGEAGLWIGGITNLTNADN